MYKLFLLAFLFVGCVDAPQECYTCEHVEWYAELPVLLPDGTCEDRPVSIVKRDPALCEAPSEDYGVCLDERAREAPCVRREHCHDSQPDYELTGDTPCPD